MARVAGVDIPDNKAVAVSLSYIFGIGRRLAATVVEKARIDGSRRVKDLTEEELDRIRKVIEW